MSDADAAEQKRIVGTFLRESPPGQLNDVFHDCQVLLDDDEAMNAAAEPALRDYTNEQFLTCGVPQSAKAVVLCADGEVAPGRYVDPRTRTELSFSYVRQAASDFAVGAAAAGADEPFRRAVEAAVDEYVGHHYPDGVASVFNPRAGELAVCVADNKYNPGNFWSGRWRAHWTHRLGSSEITGSVKVHVHYYEDGNVQLFNSKDISIKVTPPATPADLAALWPKVLTKAEHELQVALNEAYAALADGVFKALRRALPVTKTKFNWDAVAAYRIGGSLQQAPGA